MTTRDIKAAYIAEYRAEHKRAVTAGNTAHANRVASILAGYGVNVDQTVDPGNAGDPAPPETTTAEPQPETTAEPKPARKQTARKKK